MTLFLFVLFTLYFGISVHGVDGEYCTTDSSYSYSTKSEYCDYGCCGDSYNRDRKCCDAPSDYCTIDNSYSYTTKTEYCEYGCCGDSYNNDRKCCDAPSETHVAVYVGGGLGGTFSFFFTVCCIYYCCCKRETLVHVI